MEKPMKTCVYFSKNKVGRDHDNHVDIDPLKINDNALTFGVMRAPLETMETVMRCVYKPLLENEEMRWGETSVEQKMEFLGSVDGFIRGLQDLLISKQSHSQSRLLTTYNFLLCGHTEYKEFMGSPK